MHENKSTDFQKHFDTVLMIDNQNAKPLIFHFDSFWFILPYNSIEMPIVSNLLFRMYPTIKCIFTVRHIGACVHACVHHSFYQIKSERNVCVAKRGHKIFVSIASKWRRQKKVQRHSKPTACFIQSYEIIGC